VTDRTANRRAAARERIPRFHPARRRVLRGTLAENCLKFNKGLNLLEWMRPSESG